MRGCVNKRHTLFLFSSHQKHEKDKDILVLFESFDVKLILNLQI